VGPHAHQQSPFWDFLPVKSMDDGRAGDRGGQAECSDPAGRPVACCAWAGSPWGRAYRVAALAALLWTALLFLQLRLHAILEALGRWCSRCSVISLVWTHGALHNN
jgi:hypothetical protein